MKKEQFVFQSFFTRILLTKCAKSVKKIYDKPTKPNTYSYIGGISIIGVSVGSTALGGVLVFLGEVLLLVV